MVRIELPRGEGDARYAEAARLLGGLDVGGDPARRRQAGVLRLRAAVHAAAGAGRIYTRRGFFAAVRLEPFERRVVLPHEKTLAGPKEDRLKLMRATRTQISPIFGLYRDADGGAREIIDAADGAGAGARRDDRRTACATGSGGSASRRRSPAWRGLLADKQILIADGHHRYETLLGLRPRAARARLRGGRRGGRLRDDVPGARRGSGAAGAADAPAGPRICPTSTSRRCCAAAAAAFDIVERRRGDGRRDRGAARARGDRGRGVRGARAGARRHTTWFTLKSIVDLSALGPPALRKLDVTVLHGVILAPLLGIDAAALESQSYLGYTHDTAEAMARVAAGEAQAAFFMNATKVEEVLAACEAGFVLPQKSTYFQPKLATGLVMYGLDGPAPE